MIYTLFSPSEGKRPGGTPQALTDEHLLFGLALRRQILQAYNRIVGGADEAAKLALYGLKKPDDDAQYPDDILNAPCMPALLRYDGVAYDYLDYPALETNAQAYLQSNLIIFSNLFGPLLGGDQIPTYKVKQGNSIGAVVPERFYKEAFNDALDTLIGDHEILDLRAGYYDKFFRPTRPTTTMKFLKGGKTVSHWAKAYRGIVVRHLAQHRFGSVDDLLASEIPGLHIKEIHEKRNKREVICEITE